MIKYIFLAFVVYYVYINYFLPKQIQNNSQNKPKNDQNINKDEYIDYEEIE